MATFPGSVREALGSEKSYLAGLPSRKADGGSVSSPARQTPSARTARSSCRSALPKTDEFVHRYRASVPRLYRFPHTWQSCRPFHGTTRFAVSRDYFQLRNIHLSKLFLLSALGRKRLRNGNVTVTLLPWKLPIQSYYSHRSDRGREIRF